MLWLDRADARDAIETVLGHVIATLRADRTIPARTSLAWEEFFADAVNHAADDLHWLDGMVYGRQAVRAMLDVLDEHFKAGAGTA
jgi:hypothetical protein